MSSSDRELKEIEECVNQVGSKAPISKKDRIINFFSSHKAIIIVSIIILSLLLLFKPKFIKDDVTGKITFVNTLKWWIILTLGAYFSIMLNSKLT